MRYPIPEPYRDLVERLKNDPDDAVREAAQNGGKPQGGPGNMIGGSMF
jgi:hypothetical protein